MVRGDGGTVRVLVVSGEPEVTDLTTGRLKRADEFRAEMVESADEGQRRLAEGTIDCILSSYELSDADGIEFLETVRAEHPTLPFVLVTGEGSEAVASDAVSAGVTDYLRVRECSDGSVLTTRIRSAVASQPGQRPSTEAERRTRHVYERITDGFFAVNTDWEYTYVNEEGARVVGRDREDLLGAVVWDAFPELADSPFGDALRTAMDSQERTTIQEYYPPHESWYDVTIYPSQDGISIYFRDITERKRRERALERLHEATRDLMDATTTEEVATVGSETAKRVLDLPLNGIHLYDPAVEGLVPVAWTAEGEAVLDEAPPTLPVEDSLAGRVYQTGEPRSFADVRRADDIHNPATPFRSELLFPLGDHGILLVGSTATDDFDATDETLAQVLAANITSALDRVEREQELQRTNERLDEFVGVVSHDLRNPLTVATGRLELARRECDSDYLDDVAGAHARMEALLDDLLTLAQEGERIDDLEPVSLPAISEGCWQNVETGAATLVPATDRTIRADPGRLKQLVENLVRNAVEHGSDDVTVTVGDLDGGFYVADDGPGIPEGEYDTVFEAGYSTTDEGTGFGLNIVREICHAHGWEIRATDSEAGGARFEITGVDVVDG